jgi:hypothetical protein
MEVHIAGSVDLHLGRAAAPLGGAGPIRPGEGAGECLVRSVARLDRDVEHRPFGGHEPVRRPLEQDPTAKRGRGLAGDSCDDPVEVEPRQVDAQGQVLTRGLVVVQRVGENVHEGREGVGCDAHTVHSRRPARA